MATGIWQKLLGTVASTFKIGIAKATLDVSAITSPRTYAFPDAAGTFALAGNAFTQAGHGFAVGNAVYYTGSAWAKAKADAAATLGTHLVSAVADADNFTIVQSGMITGLSGLVAGSIYFVSTSTAGALTATEPSTGYTNPILLATSTTAGYVLSWRANSTDIIDIVEQWTPASAAGAARLAFPEDTDNGTSKAILTGPASIAADVTITLPATTNTLATLNGTETLTAKSLTSPTITGSPTASGATWSNLGTVTTADINGGTIDGVTIGGSSAGAGTFTTLTATGAFTSDGIDDNSPTTAITIDGSERVLIGHTSAITDGDSVTRKLQVLNVTASSGIHVEVDSTTNTHQPSISLAKSSSNTPGSKALVASGESLGEVSFWGGDGSAFAIGARIMCEVDNTASAGVVPGRLRVKTTNGSGVEAVAMKIDRSQRVLLSDGASTAVHQPVHVLNVDATKVGNVGSGTDVLMTYTMAADTLVRNGMALRITGHFTAANNANAKTLGFQINDGATTVVWTFSLTTSQVGRIHVEVLIVRTGTNAQDVFTKIIEGTGSLSTTDKVAVQSDDTASLALDETAAWAIRFTGAATSNDDITQRLMINELLDPTV